MIEKEFHDKHCKNVGRETYCNIENCQMMKDFKLVIETLSDMIATNINQQIATIGL